MYRIIRFIEGLTSSSLPSTTLKKTNYMVADPRYDNDQNLYDLGMYLGFQLLCPVCGYKTTSSKEKLLLVDFYESIRTCDICKKSISLEPFIKHIKSIFRIDPLPVREYDNVWGIIMLSVLL